jgi:hypothetical protein
MGTYDLRIAVTGFQTLTESVTVDGSTPPCKCAMVQTQTLDVVLTPGAQAVDATSARRATDGPPA